MLTGITGEERLADDIGGRLSSAKLSKQILERMQLVRAYRQALVLVFEIHLDFHRLQYDQSELNSQKNL
jgi:hypothetical protein